MSGEPSLSLQHSKVGQPVVVPSPYSPRGFDPLAQAPPPGSKGPKAKWEDWEEATYISAKGPKEKGGDVVHIPGVTVDPSSLEDTTESHLHLALFGCLSF